MSLIKKLEIVNIVSYYPQMEHGANVCRELYNNKLDKYLTTYDIHGLTKYKYLPKLTNLNSVKDYLQNETHWRSFSGNVDFRLRYNNGNADLTIRLYNGNSYDGTRTELRFELGFTNVPIKLLKYFMQPINKEFNYFVDNMFIKEQEEKDKQRKLEIASKLLA